MSPRTGDVIHTKTDLDTLPTGSWVGITSRDTFTPYEKWGTEWTTPQGVTLDPDWLPARVLHVPGEKETTA